MITMLRHMDRKLLWPVMGCLAFLAGYLAIGTKVTAEAELK